MIHVKVDKKCNALLLINYIHLVLEWSESVEVH